MISDGRLCGFIIAGRDSIPWAYMVCIDDVFGDIRSCFEGEAWVHLPSISEPNAERNTKVIEQPFSQPAEDSGIVSIRKPGFSPPQDSSATQNEKRNSAPRFAKVHVKAKKGGLRFWILIFALVLSMFLVCSSESYSSFACIMLTSSDRMILALLLPSLELLIILSRSTM